MRARRSSLIIVAGVLFVLLAAGSGLAQEQVKAPPTAADKPETETRKGIIDYMERLGEYFIRGVEPAETLFIVNQNPAVLKKLKESGKTVTIQGYTTKTGADYFFIEKIDGKKYSAAKTTPKKATTK